ncbi:MAG: conjugal transfer protein TraF [Bacteroidales bacterium]|nr:conjugal transfer protein TraF [Bacteroidales bacterium]
MRMNLRITLLMLGLFTYACSNSQSTSTKSNLSAVEFQKKMQELPKAPVIDVRTPDEFSNGHLQNAVNININNESFDSEVNKLDKNKPVFVYCLSGHRSARAGKNMRETGFKEVYELSGGMMKWRAAGLPETKITTTPPLEMSSAQFNVLLKTDKLVLVDVYADWCAPCKRMAPSIDEIKNEMASKVIVIRVNADQNKLLVKELNVTALPTLMLYKDKKMIWTNAGFLTKEEIVSHFTN